MHITFINPPLITAQNAGFSLEEVTPGLAIPYLVGAVRKAGHTASVIDALGMDIRKIRPIDGCSLSTRGLNSDEIVSSVPLETDVLAVSCMFSLSWFYVKEILEKLHHRFPGMRIIVGGEHITAVTERVFESCPFIDVAVLGEGEITLVEWLRAVALGAEIETVRGIAYIRGLKFFQTALRTRIENIDQISWPDWNGFPLESYFELSGGITTFEGRVMPMLASRGCPYTCTFCSSPTMWGTRWKARNIDNVISEIKYYLYRYQINHIEFHDLTAIIDRRWILEFSTKLKEEKLAVTWALPSGTRSEALDPIVLKAMFESGCTKVSYAPESGSHRTLTSIKKKVNLNRMLYSMRAAVKQGMILRAHLIVGFPGETFLDLLKTYWFLCKMSVVGVHDIPVLIFSPYPGSEIYRTLVAAGKIPSNPQEYEQFLSSNRYVEEVGAVESYSGFTFSQLRIFSIIGMASGYLIQFMVRPDRLFTLCFRIIFRKGIKTSLEAFVDSRIYSKKYERAL